jgi:hypothetical protein
VVAAFVVNSIVVTARSSQLICYTDIACARYLGLSSFDEPIDEGDHQWRMFRVQIPILAGFMMLWSLVGWASRAISNASNSHVPRLVFLLVGSLVFALVLHMATILWLLVLLTINYYIGKTLRVCATVTQLPGLC